MKWYAKQKQEFTTSYWIETLQVFGAEVAGRSEICGKHSSDRVFQVSRNVLVTHLCCKQRPSHHCKATC